MYPSDLRYGKSHEWVRKESDGKLTVGITDWAAKQLGEMVFIELPDVGRDLDGDEGFGTVESVKAVTEVYAPVSGKVVSANASLNDSPELVNDDPYGEGWMITLRPSDAKAYDGLMTSAGYQDYVADASD